MEKAFLILICFLLFSTCIQVLADDPYTCNVDSDCHQKCDKMVCIMHRCRCINARQETLPFAKTTSPQACIDHCKSIDEEVSAWTTNHCSCRKPSM
ncbi:hypothetical protein N665_1061s0014 [Sinapis alba]|nr:hypothetical protein N665_1061s0014 [Sinapis alba]